jgi:3-oxoacyl-[acyl-carrier protein] reductase
MSSNTSKRLEGKVAIVTGASKGIGKEIALAFAKEGAKLVITARSEELLKTLAAEIKGLGAQEPLCFPLDVKQSEKVDELVDKTLDKFGRVDILVNNAGLTRDGLLLRMSDEDWDEVMETNLKGAFLCLRAVAKPMMRQRSGRIINMASVIGLIGNAGQANYAASKAGIIALTKSAAKELGSRNILINAIAPGFIDTDMTRVLGDDVKNQILKSIPVGKLGQPSDIAKAALFLASDESSFVTGQVLTVDGGMVM